MARIYNRIRACLAAGWKNCNPLLVGLVTVAPASADGLGSLGSELERLPDAEHTFTSPDGQVRVEQYSKKKGRIRSRVPVLDLRREASERRSAESRRIRRSCQVPRRIST